MVLSILIAAYNVESFIEKCVSSCYDVELAATYEIIVVNDGSTDHTADTLENLQQSIPNLKFISQPNSGLGAARNIGLRHAKGQYVWMIDGDDFLTDNAVKTVLAALSSGLDVYAYNFNITDESGHIVNSQYSDKFPDSIMTGSEYYSLNYQSSYTAQFVFKKQLFSDNQISFKERINMQDSEILPRLLYHARRVTYNDFAIYNYVQHEASFTNTHDGTKRLRYFESIIEVGESLETFARRIKDNDALMYISLQKKLRTLHTVAFQHLVFFPYSHQTLRSILRLLKHRGYYPLQHEARGKMRLIKAGINISPLFTKQLIDFIRK